jgi:hypothetical protein
MRRFRALGWALALVVTIAGCALVPAMSPPPPGQAQREALIGSFLVALERRDAAAVAGMVDPAVDATADIASLLDRHGGIPLSDVRVHWGQDDFGGQLIHATITGTGTDGAHVIDVPVFWDGERATLVLGSAPGLDPGSDPRSPRP